MQIFPKLLATVLGIGFIKYAPGTWASLASVLIFIVSPISGIYLNTAIVVLFLSGVLLGFKAEAHFGRHDPAAFVLDEFVAMFFILAFVPSRVWMIIVAFFVFRLFDIIKPFPIKKIESLPGGWGIMLDDIGAGIYTVIVIYIIAFVVERGL